jgi:hypothetical protein
LLLLLLPLVPPLPPHCHGSQPRRFSLPGRALRGCRQIWQLILCMRTAASSSDHE